MYSSNTFFYFTRSRFSTRSVGMNLARPFKAGDHVYDVSRRVATIEYGYIFKRRYATRFNLFTLPGLERPG